MNKNSRYRRKVERKNTMAGIAKIRDGVFRISCNNKRNTQEIVFHNEDANGRKTSVTQHLPINKDLPYRGINRTVSRNHGKN